MNLKERARQLKIDLPAVFVALKHKETPLLPKILAAVTLCYALSPIDLIPDFIPILGYLDDVVLLPMLIAITIKCIPSEVFQECRRESENIWSSEMPKKWYYALPILFLWLWIIYFILDVFFI